MPIRFAILLLLMTTCSPGPAAMALGVCSALYRAPGPPCHQSRFSDIVSA